MPCVLRPTTSPFIALGIGRLGKFSVSTRKNSLWGLRLLEPVHSTISTRHGDEPFGVALARIRNPMTAQQSPAHTIAYAGDRLHAPLRSIERKFPFGRGHLVVVSMLVAIGAVTGLAWWDSQREAESALGDVASEQSVLASLLAATLRARLANIQEDAILIAERGPARAASRYSSVVIDGGAHSAPPSGRPAPIEHGLSAGSRLTLTVPMSDERIVEVNVSAAELLDIENLSERRGELAIFLAPPDDTALYASDGRFLSSSPSTEAFRVLRTGLDDDIPNVRLSRSQSAEIGLMARTAEAGLVHVDAGPLGRWGIAAVGTAARPRDREARAFWRLVLGVGVASLLVLSFGGMALRKQRKELELAHRLTVSELERERDEQLLRAARVATMGTFAMGVAHEVSTPLGVIVGRAEQLLGRVGDDERASRGAQAILKQADHIQHIVRRFLDMARGGPPSFARTDPSEVVRASASAVEHRFAKANVSLLIDTPESMPVIPCDRDLLEHAIVNLLLNACEACAPGGRVELSARLDADRIAFVVTDNGKGIRPEDAARATEPFFTTKPAGSGTGLGLAIATEIAKSHRGGLTIAPNAERGTRACIEIPIAAAAAYFA
jgi:signal transduction histidine kinase